MHPLILTCRQVLDRLSSSRQRCCTSQVNSGVPPFPGTLPRRRLLTLLLAATTLAPFRRAEAAFAVTMSDAEWRARLTPAQFAILREDATERAFSNSLMGESSPLLEEARQGTYHCVGCAQGVYPSSTKFDSGTGWPSFWDALPGAVGTKEDPGPRAKPAGARQSRRHSPLD